MNTHDTLIEHGDPASDGRAFRRCLGQFATGVTVMTAKDGEQLAGLSVNSFAALSLDPPLILWSVRRESGSWPIFRQAGHFAVNVLSCDQVELSNRFATAGGDKFSQTPWMPGYRGAPLLAGAIAHLECDLVQVHEGGDHYVLVGKVQRYARFAGEPLLFAQGRYAVLDEHPGSADGPAASRPSCPTDAAEGSLMRLLHYTSHQMSTWFDEHREAEGLTVAQFRIYGWLRTQARTLEELKGLAYLGGRDADDTVANLLERGHVEADGSGTLHLTVRGRERADASARRVSAFESDLFRDLSAEELAATRRVLGSLLQRASTHEPRA